MASDSDDSVELLGVVLDSEDDGEVDMLEWAVKGRETKRRIGAMMTMTKKPEKKVAMREVDVVQFNSNDANIVEEGNDAEQEEEEEEEVHEVGANHEKRMVDYQDESSHNDTGNDSDSDIEVISATEYAQKGRNGHQSTQEKFSHMETEVYDFGETSTENATGDKTGETDQSHGYSAAVTTTLHQDPVPSRVLLQQASHHLLNQPSSLTEICSKTTTVRYRTGLSKRVKISPLHPNLKRT